MPRGAVSCLAGFYSHAQLSGMALQFTLSHSVARLLSCCPTALRERLIRELSQRLSASPAPAPFSHRTGLEVGVLRLPSGFQVSYRWDRFHERVEMLGLSGPSPSNSFVSASSAL
jgi:hypothetical protein